MNTNDKMRRSSKSRSRQRLLDLLDSTDKNKVRRNNKPKNKKGGKSNKGNRRDSIGRTPVKGDRKFSNRNQIKIDTREWGREVKQDIEAENLARPSIAEAAPVCRLHEYIDQCRFQKATKLLKDCNLDTEHKKEYMVKFQDNYGTTPLQLALRRDAPYHLLELIVQIGGKDAVIAKDNDGRNTIHWACKLDSSSEIIDELCLFGGKDALYQESSIGELPIHNAVIKRSASVAVVQKLLEVGGREQLAHKNEYDQLPVHLSVYYFNTNLEVCKILLHEGHHHGVGGEKGVGGLFTEHTDITNRRRTTYDRLKLLNLSETILENFVNVVSEKHGITPTQAGAKHGFKWDLMKDILESTDEGAIKEGLITYAASGEKTDLETMYKLCERYCGVLF